MMMLPCAVANAHENDGALLCAVAHALDVAKGHDEDDVDVDDDDTFQQSGSLSMSWGN